MPRQMPALKQLSDLPDHKAVRIAKSNLISCGCLDLWEQLMRLSNEGRNVKLDIIRLRYCVREQCWDNMDINFQLS